MEENNNSEEQPNVNQVPQQKENFSIVKMFKEADIGLSQFKNIIGVGVIIMFIVFSMVFGYTYYRERQIAESCGFQNEKIKCVCTKEAWQWFQEKQNQDNNPSYIGNISTFLYQEDLNTNSSSINE